MKSSISQLWDNVMNRPVFVLQNEIWRHLFWAGVIAGLIVGFITGVIFGVSL